MANRVRRPTQLHWLTSNAAGTEVTVREKQPGGAIMATHIIRIDDAGEIMITPLSKSAWLTMRTKGEVRFK